MRTPTTISRREFVTTTGKAVVAVSCCMVCPKAFAAPTNPAGKKPEFKLVAPCGIYCGACDELMKSLYAKDSTKEGCRGCLSDQVPDWSERQCKVRVCALQKKLESCALCASYPNCDKLKSVLNWSKTEANLQRIKDKGLDSFKKEQKAKWSCKKCGAPFGNKDKQCRKCGVPVASVK